MTIVPGKVVNGHIEVEDFELPDGAEVTVWLDDDRPELELSNEELAELDAAIAEADRGEGVPARDVLREIRALRDAAIDERR